MIHLILGENAYKAEQELARLIEDKLDVERIDATGLDESGLSNIMRGATLFASERTVIVKQLSEQKELLAKVVEWAEFMPNETALILMDRHLDKRTKTYKELAKLADVHQADYWTDRDERLAVEWLDTLARDKGMTLTPAICHNMVQRAMVAGERSGTLFVDQMQLAQAVKALSALPEVTDEAIAAVLPPAAGESVFRLLELAVQRDTTRLEVLLKDLERDEEPHMVFAMLAKQWSQLVMVALTGQRASELGIHPFALGKLQSQARDMSRSTLHELTQLAADLDVRLKLSEVTPWDAVHRLMMAIALR